MLTQIIRTCLGLGITLGSLTAASQAKADDFSRVDVHRGVLEIEASPADDMIGVEVSPENEEELAIYILHFFTSAPSLEFASIEEGLAAADDYRIEYRDRDRIDEIWIHAHEGNDIVIIQTDLEVPCTIFGGKGDDFISGGAADDILHGDDLDGVGGNDIIFGNQGNDSIDGGDSDDQLRGGYGEDVLLGGNGNDQLYGDDSNDELHCGEGNDSASGGSGDDILKGEAGDDTLTGDDGLDQLDGGFGDDILEGSFDGYSDTLIGGRGADTFRNKYIKIVWKYRKRFNRLTRQWEYSKGKTIETLEADLISDLDRNAGDVRKSTIVEN